MTIRIWQAYSCNNSSAYRLLARFTDAASARVAADELRGFFTEHAREVDARERFERTPSQAQRALAARYGFSWTEIITWGDGGLEGDEPELVVHEATLVVAHGYCGGGLGDGVPAFLRARGATVDASVGDLEVTVLFAAKPGEHPELDAQLAAMFAELAEQDDEPESLEVPWVEPVPVPWETERESYGHVAVFRDAGTVGLHVTIEPLDLELVQRYLAAHGIERSAIELYQPANGRLFRALRRARCRACEGPLEYLDPRLHDIETPQLVCKPCGGLYEVATFLA